MHNRVVAFIEEDVPIIAEHDLPWGILSGCQIMVTGSTGFLGGYLVRTLLKLYPLGKVSKPISIIAMVRNMRSASVHFNDLENDPHFSVLEWDLNTLAIPDLGSTQYVLHAASHASPKFYGHDPVGTLLPNTVGTAALLEALRRAPDPRGFLFVSSSEVYGAFTEEVSLDETNYGVVDPATVRACYAESKRMGETMCLAWNKQYAIPTYIARPFHTYGPGLRPDDGRVVADFALNIIRNENIVMLSDGAARRAFCYATDAITGFMTALLKGKPGVPYNVANPAGELSVAELGELLLGLYPEKQLKLDRRFQHNNVSYLPSTYDRLIPDVQRLEALGWKAKITPERGLKRMIEAYLQ